MLDGSEVWPKETEEKFEIVANLFWEHFPFAFSCGFCVPLSCFPEEQGSFSQ